MRLNRVNRDKDPDNVDALNRKGCLFVKMKQYKEAIEVYDMAISINSKKANVYHNKGIALKHLNRNKEALQYLKLATDLGEHCILSFTAKGEVEQLLGRGPEALASFKQAKRLLGDPLATKGLSEGNMEYIKKSLQNFIQLEHQLHDEAQPTVDPNAAIMAQLQEPKQQMNQLNKENEEIKKQVQEQKKEEETVKALNHVNRILDQDPDNVDALNRKGCLLDGMKKHKEAIKVYDKAISINDKKANVYHNKGIALVNLKRNKEALQCFQIATDLDEHFILGFAAKAEVEQLLGRGPEALASLKQAKRLLDDPLATNSLSEIEVQFIKKSVESIIQLEQQFHDPIADIMAKLQEHEKKIEQLEKVKVDMMQEQEQMKQVMQDAGVYDSVIIKAAWEKYRKDDPDLYDYIRAFYWTMLNLCEAYRMASTGALQTNVGHRQQTMQFLGDFMFQIGAPVIIENLTTCGEFAIGVIKGIIDGIVADFKDHRYEGRINPIVKIITNNEDPDAQSLEDFNKVLARAALEIADHKRLQIQAKNLESENTSLSGKIKKNLEFIMGKYEKLKKQLLGENVEIYQSEGGTAALVDVTLLLVFMTKNHKEIIEDTKNGKKLYVIISDEVHKRKILDILKDINMDDIERAMNEANRSLKAKTKTLGSQNQKHGKRCVLM